jgi:serine/threonine protein kinase
MQLQRIGANCAFIVKCFAVGAASTPGSTALSMELASAGDAFKGEQRPHCTRHTVDSHLTVLPLAITDMSDAGAKGYEDSPRLKAAARAVAGATAHCHGLGVAHRDIKPENVLMFTSPVAGEHPHAKLCDFGAAAIAPRSTLRAGDAAPAALLSSRTVGSSQYCAPEIMAIHHARRAGEEAASTGAATPRCVSGVASQYNAYGADVWSWAVTVYVLGSHKVPFKKAHVSDYRFRAFLAATQGFALEDAAADVSGHRRLTARESSYTWSWPSHFSQSLVQLLSACMRFRADERPSMAWVLQHPWMQAHTVEVVAPGWLPLSPRESVRCDSPKLPCLVTGGGWRNVVSHGALGAPVSPGCSFVMAGTIGSVAGGATCSLASSLVSACCSSAAGSSVGSTVHSARSSAVSCNAPPDKSRVSFNRNDAGRSNKSSNANAA